MRAELTDNLLQLQTGHKTRAMLDRYGNHKLATNDRRVREAQERVFSFVLSRPQRRVIAAMPHILSAAKPQGDLYEN
jgi:hypothetical protein